MFVDHIQTENSSTQFFCVIKVNGNGINFEGIKLV